MKPTEADEVQARYDKLLDEYFGLLEAYQNVWEDYKTYDLDDDSFKDVFLNKLPKIEYTRIGSRTN